MKTPTINWPPGLPRVLWVRRKCPRCSGIQFKQAESAWQDSPLAFVGLRAIRCVNCWRRYYSFARENAVGE